MTTTAKAKARGGTDLKREGIFGPRWHMWREALLKVEIPGAEVALMRLDEVRKGGTDQAEAALTELDPVRLMPIGQVTMSWPPRTGKVTVLRTK